MNSFENSILNNDSNLNFDYNKFNEISYKLDKSKKLNLVLTIALSILIIVIAIISIIALFLFTNIKKNFKGLFGKNFKLASVSQISSNNNINLENFATKLAFIDDVINIMYYYDKDNEKVEDAMFSGYMSALGDKYAEYYPKKEFAEFTEKTTEGVYYGIGCLVTQDQKTKDCIVNTVYENSPAEKGGIKEGDIFVSVNGEYIRGIYLNDLIQKIKGEEGAKREIEIYRPAEDKIHKLTVFCGKVDIKLINSTIYENDIGYINIGEFTGKASEQFKNEIDKLIDQNVKGIIIDLRDNPGGELMTVCEMMDYLVRDNDGKFTLNQKETMFEDGKTLLVYIKEKDEIMDAAYGNDKHSVELPFVILTNLNTASAAELFTECLRDYNKAKVVGIKTYGKGVVQNIIPYEDGSAIKFTVSEYFPPSGYSIDKKGILPDYSLDYYGNEINYDNDNNLVIIENDSKITLDNEGQILNEEIATKSTISEITKKIETVHSENLKIYDENNSFLNEKWFTELDEKYDDKQLLQAIVIMKQ